MVDVQAFFNLQKPFFTDGASSLTSWELILPPARI